MTYNGKVILTAVVGAVSILGLMIANLVAHRAKIKEEESIKASNRIEGTTHRVYSNQDTMEVTEFVTPSGMRCIVNAERSGAISCVLDQSQKD